MDSDWVLIPLGFLACVLLVGAGLFLVFQIQPDTPGGNSDFDSYPVGPEKPIPLNSSNVVDYTVTYEERLFYNDILEHNNNSLYDDEGVITNCTSISTSNDSTDGFHVQLECRGGVTDSSQLAESEEFMYSVTYRVTTNTTQQTEFQNYPFDKDRQFNREEN
ncbi:hypothetical protein [Natrinema sp. DC36]|uniref:hypothetical protein n=1 Tax=Natrinema sp. DC36 TaxID=2878680 RepID=UPI001CF036A2|nr:hypothetical protein [Natrinema sp. DC36]